MSANNYGVCPQCLVRSSEAEKEKLRQAERAYGKVTAAEYKRLIDNARQPTKVNDESLREDYEIHVNRNGKFYVSYYGSCEQCGLKFSYQDEFSIHGGRSGKYAQGPLVSLGDNA